MLQVTVNVMERFSASSATKTCYDPFSAMVTLLAATNLDDVWSRFSISSLKIS